jgi:hypothetical protein
MNNKFLRHSIFLTFKTRTMKKQLHIGTALLILLLLNYLPADAKVWRVNNASNYNGTTLWGDNLGGTQTNPVFEQINQAAGANFVIAGDTLHVEGATAVYGNSSISKRLTIIGPGYLLDENTNSSNMLLEAKVGALTFQTGSNGSEVIGVYVTGTLGISISNAVNNITIKRCRIDFDVNLASTHVDIFILQNYFANINNSQASVVTVNTLGFPTNFIFNNNIVRGTLLLFNSSTTYTAAEVKNNVFDCPAISANPSIRLNTGSFQNNILKNPAAAANVNNNNSVNVSFNVSSSNTNQFGIANNNIVVTNINSIFVDPVTNSSDGDYQLLSSWATANPGADGAPRGAFGGASPTRRYTLSGLPPIPVIYDISTSGVAGPGGLQVTIKAKVVQ